MFSVQTLGPHITRNYCEFLTPTSHADQTEFLTSFTQRIYISLVSPEIGRFTLVWEKMLLICERTVLKVTPKIQILWHGNFLQSVRHSGWNARSFFVLAGLRPGRFS